MLTQIGCRARQVRLWENLPAEIDWVLLADPLHLMYFVNYFQSPFDFRPNEALALLILGRDGSSILFADNLLQPYAERAFVTEIVAPTWYRSLKSAPHRGQLLVRSAVERLRRCGGTAFGCEASHVPAGIIEGLRESRPNARFTPLEEILLGLRRRKDADELELLLRSIRAGEAGMAAGRAEIRPGMTELEAYLVVQSAAIRAAGHAAVVYGDFLTGSRTLQVGGPPASRRVEAGDLVLLDFSTVLCHYRADLATTFVCQGEPTAEQRRVQDACLHALKSGEELLRPGVPARDLHATIRETFADRGLGDSYPYHAGHGIGLGHPEAPFLVPESADVLEAGDVVTLEPGQYVPGVGGMRFERNYLITPEGHEVLSRHALTLEG